MNFPNWLLTSRLASRRDLREYSQQAAIATRALRAENERLRRDLRELTDDVRLLESALDVLVGAFEKRGTLDDEVLQQVAAARRAGQDGG